MSEKIIDSLINRYPALKECKDDIIKSFNSLVDCFKAGNKLLIAGNGGSCSDAEHIVGELMKGFVNKRPVAKEFSNNLEKVDSCVGKELSDKLQRGLPAIALHNHQSLNTAFSNDVENGGELFYAEQVLNYGRPGDVFLGISTSGNAKNVYAAAVVAKAKGMKIIALTGCSGGKLKEISDVSIKAPAKETYLVQEYHLPIYHALCLMLEEEFFN